MCRRLACLAKLELVRQPAAVQILDHALLCIRDAKAMKAVAAQRPSSAPKLSKLLLQLVLPGLRKALKSSHGTAAAFDPTVLLPACWKALELLAAVPASDFLHNQGLRLCCVLLGTVSSAAEQPPSRKQRQRPPAELLASGPAVVEHVCTYLQALQQAAWPLETLHHMQEVVEQDRLAPGQARQAFFCPRFFIAVYQHAQALGMLWLSCSISGPGICILELCVSIWHAHAQTQGKGVSLTHCCAYLRNVHVFCTTL